MKSSALPLVFGVEGLALTCLRPSWRQGRGTRPSRSRVRLTVAGEMLTAAGICLPVECWRRSSAVRSTLSAGSVGRGDAAASCGREARLSLGPKGSDPIADRFDADPAIARHTVISRPASVSGAFF